MKKGWIVGIACVLLAVGIYLPFQLGGEVREVYTAQASYGDIEVSLSLTGEVAPAITYTVTNLTGGRVEEVLVEEGQIVKKGDAILQLDTSDAEKQLEAAKESAQEAAIATGTSSSSLAQAKQRELVLRAAQSASFELHAFNQLINEEEEEEAQTTSATITPEDSILETREIQALNQQIANATCKTELEGKVLKVLTSEGETLPAATPAAVIGDMNSLEVTAYVSEKDLGRLRVDMPCTFTIQSLEDTFTGRITSLGGQLGEMGTDGLGNKMCAVKITPDEPLSCPAGSTAEVSLTLNSTQDVLTLPLDAVSSEGTVFILKEDGTVRKTMVKTGMADDYSIEIYGGVEENDVVVLDPDDDLEDGMKVRAID